MEGVRPRSEVRQAALRPGGPAGPRSARRGSSSVGAGNLTGPGSGCGPRTGHGVRVEWWPVGEGRSLTVGLLLLRPLWVCVFGPVSRPASGWRRGKTRPETRSNLTGT